jgi:hypothetical protein
VSISEIPNLIADLYKITTRLEEIFAGRCFTPDGHLVGSIGEVVAEHIYGLCLANPSTTQFDANTFDNRTVQIKLTGKKGSSYGFRWSNIRVQSPPDLLIALKLTDNGFAEIYNGPFPLNLLLQRADTSNGQLSISLSKLKLMNPKLLEEVNSLENFNRLFLKRIEIV